MRCNRLHGTALFLSCLLLAAQGGFAYQAAAPQAAQLSAAQLQQLVAPIALYPDPLIAQILAAATYPDQIVEADKWMQQNKGLQGEQLAQELNKRPWDPSVKALTQFPAVLGSMGQNLAWTSELGDAYINQRQQLTEAIQIMRERAMKAGTLKSTPQQRVGTQGNMIVIEPVEPNVVYVPQYDPWLAYGAPVATFPGWYSYPGLYLEGAGFGFGLPIGVGLFSGYGWGWHNWGYDWRGGGRAVYNRHAYVTRGHEIVRRGNVHPERAYRGGGGFAGRTFGRHPQAHAFAGPHRGPGRGAASRAIHPRAGAGAHARAYGGYRHGGAARGNALRGRSGFHAGGRHGGGHGGGAFRAGGFHGGGGHAFRAGGGGFHAGGGHGGGGHGGGGHGGHGGGRR